MALLLRKTAVIAPTAEYYGDALAGVETTSRLCATGSITMATGSLRLTYFTPTTSFLMSTIISATTGTAAAATPTLCRMGLYTVAANGDITLVASHANDTTLWAATNTEYAKALTASYTLAAGTRYAMAAICVTGAAAPTLMGSFIASPAVAARAPALSRVLTAQTDLPGSVVFGSLATNANILWMGGV